MSTEASPVVELPVPLASVLTTLMLQLARVAIAGFGIASGGPKKQFAIGWTLSPMAPESVSDVEVGGGSGRGGAARDRAVSPAADVQAGGTEVGELRRAGGVGVDLARERRSRRGREARPAAGRRAGSRRVLERQGAEGRGGRARRRRRGRRRAAR